MREPIRRLQVLALVLRGYANKDIAEHLNMSIYTARDHVSVLLKTHGVKRRAELMALHVSNAKMRKIAQPPTSVGLCPNINET
ncbi:LuxR C-terminal-related transcriptional regulator [Pseudomonas sp. Pseusp122]|uniref:LuxR C-terminal-related transcriptional regulator n=1 Tax=unclassified Pseudomonas TaxID=196821 RepID=UPI0039A4A158